MLIPVKLKYFFMSRSIVKKLKKWKTPPNLNVYAEISKETIKKETHKTLKFHFR